MRPARTLLVQMPWRPTGFPALECSVLKSFLRAQGRACDVIYPSLLWARRIGIEANDRLARLTVFPEWFFAQCLFGRRGTREMDFRWTDLKGCQGADRERGEAFFRILGETGLAGDRLGGQEAPRFLEACLSRYPWDRYDVVGFATRVNQNLAALAMARLLKLRYPKKLIVLGGDGVVGEMGREQLRAFEWIDAVVNGEGERPLLEIIKAMETGGLRGPIPGVLWRSGQELVCGPRPVPVEPEGLPFTDHSDYYRELKACRLDGLVIPRLYFEGSRGCRWGAGQACRFCGVPEKTYRPKTGRRVMNELRWLARRHATTQVIAADNALAVGGAAEFLTRMKRSGLDWRLHGNVKAGLKRAQIQLLATAGAQRVLCGIETLSTRALGSLHKGSEAIDNLQLLKHLREFGVTADWTLLSAIPGLQAADYEQILGASCAASHLEPPQAVERVWVYRFSDYFEHPSRAGLKRLRPASPYELIFPAGRVRLDRFAYFFDHDLDDEPMHARYRDRLKQLVGVWTQDHRDDRLFLYYERLPGRLKVYDSRLLEPRALRIVFRLHELRGLDAGLLLQMGSVRTEAELLRSAAKFGGAYRASAVRESLARLVSLRLAYAENGRFLALVLPAGAYSEAVRAKARLSALRMRLTA